MPNDFNDSQNNQEELDLEKDQTQQALDTDPYQSNNQLSKGQKISAVFLVFFAVIFLMIWMVQFRSSIVNSNRPNSSSGYTASQGTVTNDDASLRELDTDNDGLTDYDELYVYETSPYLEDSDSDGFSDSEELANGNDPNCPAGRDCYGLGTADTSDTGGTGGGTAAGGDDFTTNLLQQSVLGTGEEDTYENVLKGDVDAATLRQVLLDSGMDPEILRQVSDEELMSTYADTLNTGN